MHKAIKELYDIINVEGDGFRTGWRMRKIELDDWIRKWIQNVDNYQLVTHSKYLSPEYKDYLIQKISSDILEEIIEQCAEITTEKRQINVKLTVLRKNERT